MKTRFMCALALTGMFLGCEGPDNSSTAVAFNPTGVPTVEFSVPDMMCEEGCAAATREILTGQEGVKDVKVDFPAKVVTVAVDEETFDADKALADLIDHGFDNSTLKTVQ